MVKKKKSSSKTAKDKPKTIRNKTDETLDLYDSVMEMPDIFWDEMSMDFMDEAIDCAMAHTGHSKEICETVIKRFLFLIREYLVRGFEVDLYKFSLVYRFRKYSKPKLSIPKVVGFIRKLKRSIV